MHGNCRDGLAYSQYGKNNFCKETKCGYRGKYGQISVFPKLPDAVPTFFVCTIYQFKIVSSKRTDKCEFLSSFVGRADFIFK